MAKKRRNPNETRIVITGLGAITPIGNNVQDFWDNLLKGKNGIRTIQNFNTDEISIKFAGEVDFDRFHEYMPKKMLPKLGRFIFLSQVASIQAFKDSGIQPEDVEKDPTNYGAIIGTGDGGSDIHVRNIRNSLETLNWDGVSPFYVVGLIANAAAGYFAKSTNFQGPNFSVSSACATSNHAIITAANLIKMGYADVIISGGTESTLNFAGLSAFNAIYALSRRNDSPETASRPFDKDRDGFVMGEGAGILCLEELEHAKKRGAKIYAEITGLGISCDAYDIVVPHPEGRGAMLAMKNAMEDAELNPEDIDVINAHGTSTILGDLSETSAIRKAFGKAADNILVHSTKSMIGHLIGAAGGTEAVASVQTILKNVVHPSINIFEQDPRIDLKIAANKPYEKKVTNVLSNSFGFGGQNSSIIISRFKG
jgi:3-oxoacyl-[acyl-carrier-protein] synthase II